MTEQQLPTTEPQNQQWISQSQTLISCAKRTTEPWLLHNNHGNFYTLQRTIWRWGKPWPHPLHWKEKQHTCMDGVLSTQGKSSPWIIIIIVIYPLTTRVIGAPQMILQPVCSIFPCSPLPTRVWWTPGLSIPWCCLPTSSSVCLVFFPLSLCLARWFWPNLINGRHDHTTAVCISLRWSEVSVWSDSLLDSGTDFLIPESSEKKPLPLLHVHQKAISERRTISRHLKLTVCLRSCSSLAFSNCSFMAERARQCESSSWRRKASSSCRWRVALLDRRSFSSWTSLYRRRRCCW